MQVRRHRLENIPFDASPHVGGALTPRFIVLHYTAGGSAQGSVAAIKARGLSAHLFLDRDGRAIQTVPFDLVALHAGPSNWRGVEGLNQAAIGIECANLGWLDQRVAGGWTRGGLGRVLPDDQVRVARHKHGGPELAWELFPAPQLDALAAVILALRAAYPAIQEVIGHDDIAPRRKLDPGPAFPMARFQALGAAAGEFEVVARDTLNLRGGPGTDFAIVRKLAPRTRLRVVGEHGAWRQVDLEGDGVPDGFAHGAFLRRVAG